MKLGEVPVLESETKLSLRSSSLVVGRALDGDHLLEENLQLVAVKLDGHQGRKILGLVALVGEVLNGEAFRLRHEGDALLHGLLVRTGVFLAVHEDLLSLSLSEILEVVLQGLRPVRVIFQVLGIDRLGFP